MRIALFHNRYRERGGEDAAVDAQLELLRKAGHEVRLHTVDNREEIRGLAGALRAGRRARWNATTFARLGAWLGDTRPDVAHVHNFFPLLSPSLHHALRERGIPVVQSLHNYRLVCANGLLRRAGNACRECVERGPWRAVRHGCYRGSRVQTAVWSDLTAHHRRRGTWRDCVDRFVAPSEAARRELVAGGLPGARTLVIPNVVPDPGAPLPPGRGAVYVGRLAAEKGVDLLLDAWRDLADVPLTLVGGGPEEPRLRARAAGLSRVRWLGAVARDRALAAIAGAGFVVVPSRAPEVFGMSTLEALASARPVVVPRGSAMAELVDAGRTGLHFESGDRASLARACRRLADDPETAALMGEEGRRDYEDHHAPEVVLAALERLYRSLSR